MGWAAAIYNILLIFFIALHLAMSFLVGIYAGVYLSQNYDLPRVDEPRVLWEKINSFAEKYRKPSPPEDK